MKRSETTIVTPEPNRSFRSPEDAKAEQASDLAWLSSETLFDSLDTGSYLDYLDALENDEFITAERAERSPLTFADIIAPKDIDEIERLEQAAIARHNKVRKAGATVVNITKAPGRAQKIQVEHTQGIELPDVVAS